MSSVQGPTRVDLSPQIVREILERTAGRSRVVVEHVLEYGFITTTELAQKGYDHPPRAAADVRDRGIPLLTVTRSIDGKRVGHYRFPDDLERLDEQASGRVAISKKFRGEVIGHYGLQDLFTGNQIDQRQLQIDHRVPFRISGDPVQPFRVADFMPVSAAMNRAKSWECEACLNWVERDPSTCASCYWAFPDGGYKHVAMSPIRRLDLAWAEDEVSDFDRLVANAEIDGVDVREAAKRLIARSIRGDADVDD